MSTRAPDTITDYFGIDELSAIRQTALDRLINSAVTSALRQAEAAELARWSPCFSTEASQDKDAQTRRIVTTASARYVCALLASDAPD